MREELDKKLVEKYPKIFAQRYDDMTTTAMCWGFECDDGWYQLIDTLCNTIQQYTDSNSTRHRIKNKFIRKINEVARKSSVMNNYTIVRHVMRYIFNVTSQSETETYETIPQVIATQVKEKYGGLRFYYNGGDRLIDGMVWLAESMSYRTCEVCGSTENVTQTKGWVYTRCEKCHKNYEDNENY